MKVEKWAVLGGTALLTGCALSSGDEGNPALKLFSALGISLAAVFIIFFIVVKCRERK